MARHLGWEMIAAAARFVETRLVRGVVGCADRVLPGLRLPVSPTAESARLVLRHVRSENRFFVHGVIWLSAAPFLIALNLANEPDEPWSLIVIAAWGLVVALHGRRSLRRRRRRFEARHRALTGDAGDAGASEDGAVAGREDSGSSYGQLRDKLLRAAAATREALRASRPEVLPEITQGETRALELIHWLGDAEPVARRFRVDHRLRRATATRLSEVRGRAAREPLARLLEQLDAHEQRLGDLERTIAGRRARVESFLLALESTKAAGAVGGDPGTVSASLRERIALLAPPEAAVEDDAQDAARDAAAASAGARFEHEVRLARDLQRSILPAAAPRVDGLRVAHLYRPSNEVGGDFYDFYDTGEGRLLVAIGDASGHGLDSSMVSSMAKSAVYMQLAGRREQAAERLPAAMAEINRMMCDTLGRRRLMSLALVELDSSAATLHWVNAGQVYPLLRRGGRVRELEQPGYPLGVRRELEYPVRTESLEPGDRLLLLTDGYVEALNPDGEPLGWERLIERLRRSRAGPRQAADVESFLGELGDVLDAYLQTPQPQDDVTLIAIDYLP